jgi:hypothetical protein
MPHETVNDDLFGKLTWDSDEHEWHGRSITAGGLAFRLRIETGAWNMAPPIDDAKVDRTISDASRRAFLRFRDSEQQAREGLVDEFVPLHAEWHGGEISPADFKARLQLDTVQIISTGAMQVFYNDDDMFGGHCLITHLGASGAFDHGEMFG